MRLLPLCLSLMACVPSAGPSRCADAIGSGDLVITEVLANPVGPDEGREWFEIYNATGRPIDLSGLALVHSRPDGSSAAVHHMRPLPLAAGAYLALGDVAPDRLPPTLGYGYGGDLGALYNSGGGKLALECGDAVIDAITYDDVEEGHARELGAGIFDATANDDPAKWCRGDTPFDAADDGTPGQPNDCTPVGPGECLDDGRARALRPPAPGALAISEIMPSPAVQPAGEWFEIENTGDTAFDLDGLALDRAGDTRAPDPVPGPACAPLAPGAYALFARSADPAANGGLPPVDGTFGFAMPDAQGDVRVLAGSTVLDAASWTGATKAVSQQLVPTACPAVTTYGDGANRGTPKAVNQCM